MPESLVLGGVLGSGGNSTAANTCSVEGDWALWSSACDTLCAAPARRTAALLRGRTQDQILVCARALGAWACVGVWTSGTGAQIALCPVGVSLCSPLQCIQLPFLPRECAIEYSGCRTLLPVPPVSSS